MPLGCLGCAPPLGCTGAAPRRLNWTEAISRAQWAPTKGPSLLNQRLGTIHGGAGEARGAGGWVPDPPGHAKPGYALENESPAGRSAGGCQVVGAGPRPPGWVAIGPKPKPRGAGGAPGPLRGEGGAAASPRLLFKPHNYQGLESSTGLCSAPCIFYLCCGHLRDLNEGGATVCRCQDGSRRPQYWGKKIR